MSVQAQGPSRRPDKKALLQIGVASLNLGKPLRMNHQISRVPAEHAPIARTEPVTARQEADATLTRSTSFAPVIEERGSTADSVTAGQSQEMTLSRGLEAKISHKTEGHAVTVSPRDPVTGSQNDSVTTGQSHGETVSTRDRVKSRHSQGVTLSEETRNRRHRTVFREKVLKPKECFCAVPNAVFFEGGLFENSFDFMIYLHLFSKSYGFGRNTCDMGLNELVAFTGLARNSVRKSIERLTAAKWIRMIQDFEYGRVSRKWRVYEAYEIGKADRPTYVDLEQAGAVPPHSVPCSAIGSAVDSVTVRQCHAETLSELADDPLTGSPRDTYRNSIQKQFKNTLSPDSETLRTYFDELKPQRKRESELKAFQELKADYSEQDIAACLDHVLRLGAPGGQSVHSPMAFLAVGMAEVLGVVSEARERRRRRDEEEAKRIARETQEREEFEREERERKIREWGFCRAFPSENQQTEVVREICIQHSYPAMKGVVGRAFALAAWWRSLDDGKRAELSAQFNRTDSGALISEKSSLA